MPLVFRDSSFKLTLTRNRREVPNQHITPVGHFPGCEENQL
jgi:hypothetical protein